jgi:DNA polymerase III subunit epsilon
METGLFYDTETTGLPDFKAPSEDPKQPHIVQLGAVLLDMRTRKRLATLDLIIKPEGWTIPDEVSAIHGITTEHAALVGVPESLAVEMLLELNARCDYRVAHNESFDQRIVRIGCKRFFDEDSAEQWKTKPTRCTAVMAGPIMQMPPTEKMKRAGFNKFKTPKLSEAVPFFCGRELTDAHSALADVNGCIDIFFEMLDSGAIQAAAA